MLDLLIILLCHIVETIYVQFFCAIRKIRHFLIDFQTSKSSLTHSYIDWRFNWPALRVCVHDFTFACNVTGIEHFETAGLDCGAVLTYVPALVSPPSYAWRVARRGRGLTAQLWRGGTGCLASQVLPHAGAWVQTAGLSMHAPQTIVSSVNEVRIFMIYT